MNYYFTTLVFLFFGSILGAQIQSDCNVSSELAAAYERDVKGLVVNRMQDLNSPDYDLVDIPQSWQDSILEGMAAILHAPGLLESDSVFNQYCVHYNYGNTMSYGFLVGIEDGSTIAQAWEAENTLTGEPFLDSLLTKYGFELQNYISSINVGVLYTDQYLNLYALGNLLTTNVNAVQYGEPDFLIGSAGSIFYNLDAQGNRLYDFRLEWNDCFDGCDNFYTWKFSVSPDCEVTFLGTQEGGVFGIEPLPDPVNCMLTSNTEETIKPSELVLYPNPVINYLYLENSPQKGNWQIVDVYGKTHLKGVFPQIEIQLDKLPKGMYWLRYEEKGSVASLAFVK